MAPIDPVPTQLVPYLLTKPFLILTGPSGTGKTKGIVELATCFDYGAGLPATLEASRESPSTSMSFVPVGADWTDERHLLGYRNAFGPERVGSNGSKTNVTYEHCPALRLLLRATHPLVAEQPHFLVLDEMNLSHVERYFSSFLSMMEADRSASGGKRFELLTRDDVALLAEVLDPTVHPMEAAAATDLRSKAQGLPLPDNVFVVGTVNVDETTYMFSPKVLDRAFVIELPALSPSAWLSSGSPPTATAPGTVVAAAFKEAIAARRTKPSAPLDAVKAGAAAAGLSSSEASKVADDFAEVFTGIFDLLNPVGFPFGFRTVVESAQFVARKLLLDAAIGKSPAAAAAIDAAIVTKVLPKIHGNRRQLAGSLEAISHYLQGHDAKFELAGSTIAVSKPGVGALPASAAKAEALHNRLSATGYATFIA